MGDDWVAAAFDAARRGDLHTLERMLDDTPTGVNRRGENDMVLLHIAAERDDVEMIQALLDRGADGEVRAAWGQTPFEWAANMNCQGAAQALLARGAGRMSLWTAAALGLSHEIESFFREDGTPAPEAGRAPREGDDVSGWAADTAYLRGDHVSDAFYIACRNGHEVVARILRDHGADPDARGYFGAPAVHWAAAGGHEAIITWLIEEGADPRVRDPRFDGDAASWAREFGHQAIADRIDELIAHSDEERI